MTDNVKTPVNTEAREKDREEQATFDIVSVLTKDEYAQLLEAVYDESSDINDIHKLRLPVSYDDVNFFISLLDKKIAYYRERINSNRYYTNYFFECVDNCSSAIEKLRCLLSQEKDREEQVTLDLKTPAEVTEAKENDRKEEKHVEEVNPKNYLTPVYIEVLKKALDNYKFLCIRELRDPEVYTDYSLYETSLNDFNLTVDLLYQLSNVRNVVFEGLKFLEVPNEDEMPF